jgi:hypothetical protein
MVALPAKTFDTSGKSAATIPSSLVALLQRPSDYRFTFDLTTVLLFDRRFGGIVARTG